MERKPKKFELTSFWLTVALTLAILATSGCWFSPDAKEARFLEAGKKELAKKDYARAAIQFQNAVRIKKGDAEPYYQLALAYEGMGQHRLAYQALTKALDQNPNHLQAQIKMAELLAWSSDQKYVRDGGTLARKVLAASPDNVDALNALAIAEWKLGQPRNAEMDLMRALNRAPQNLQASFNLARMKLIQKDFSGAEDIIKKAMAASPKSAGPVVALGGLYMKMGKPQAAEQQYQRALQLEPNNDLALVSLGNLYFSSKRMEQAEQIYKQISALSDPKYRPEHAIFLWDSGKRQQALAELEKLAKNDTSDRAARSRLIEAYFALNRLSDAEKLVTTALKKNPKDVDALIQRSRIYLTAGNINEAQKDVAQVLHFQPESARAHYIVAQIRKSQKETLGQRQELSEALRLDKFLLPARLELAELLLGTNGATTALQILDETPDSQKSLLPVVVQRNWALYAVGNMADFRKGIDQGLSHIRTSDLLIQDGLSKLAQRKFPESRAALEEALKVSPGDVRSLQVMRQTYVAQNQPGIALQKVVEYASRQPKSAPVQEFLGSILLAKGEWKQARAAFEAVKAADPKSAEADLQLARLDALEGKLDLAQKSLIAIVSRNDNRNARLWLANIDELKGDHMGAIEQLRKVVDTNSNNAQATNNLAYLLAEYSNETDAALKYAQKAVELVPGQPAYCDTLGWILYRKGVYPSAVKYLERANSSKPDDALWKYHLAMAYARSGKLDQGRTTLQAGLKLNPSLPEAKVAQQVLGAAH